MSTLTSFLMYLVSLFEAELEKAVLVMHEDPLTAIWRVRHHHTHSNPESHSRHTESNQNQKNNKSRFVCNGYEGSVIYLVRA